MQSSCLPKVFSVRHEIKDSAVSDLAHDLQEVVLVETYDSEVIVAHGALDLRTNDFDIGTGLK
ncbi:hypothetical protein [Devosia sp. SD17-2]|uniref:hypothetical protein n=1 Tax=Devosia sp. SD17-2 TaxID=2976459 RepID=UPI0023D80894|nr:hypothetical protein [Devosia sp. SD17-2]WEJ33841.1 hypothetical protein NYQ88_03235 [Devosia sp. SD17-2]